MLQLLVELPPGAYAPGGQMQPELIVLPAPTIGQDLSLRSDGKQLGIEEHNPEPAVVDAVDRSSYDLTKPFSHGDPGSM
jgi:hypothetical protein